MQSLIKRSSSSLLIFLLALTYPILSVGSSHLVWSLSFVALIVLTACVALMQMQWHYQILAGIGLVAALLASYGQWVLLPLLLAQIGLALILSTQQLEDDLNVSGLLLIAGFMQVAVTMSQSHVLTHTFLLDLAFQLLPFILAAFARRMPSLMLAIGELVIIIAAYAAQRFTIVTALACIVLALLPLKRKQAWWPAYWLAAALIVGVVLHLTMLHG